MRETSPKLWNAALAEALGAFALVLISMSATAAAHAHSDWTAAAIGRGAAVASLMAATAGLSGGHLNPAITLGFSAARRITLARAIVYVAAQLAGAVLAAYAAYSLFGDQFVRSATPALDLLRISPRTGTAAEAMITSVLAFIFLTTSTGDRASKAMSPLWVGMWTAAAVTFAGTSTGAAMNPALAFGPALASGNWSNQWVYWVGPLVGALLAGVLCRDDPPRPLR